MYEHIFRNLHVNAWSRLNGCNGHSTALNPIRMDGIGIQMLRILFECLENLFECYETHSNGWNLHPNGSNPVQMVEICIRVFQILFE